MISNWTSLISLSVLTFSSTLEFWENTSFDASKNFCNFLVEIEIIWVYGIKFLRIHLMGEFIKNQHLQYLLAYSKLIGRDVS